jgi:glycosyltransferase involved in cell wall biosynthesis
MKKPGKVLLVYSSRPPILDYFSGAFARAGIETDCVVADQNSAFDKWVIHPVNKRLHNLRILPKNKFAFENHPLAHKNFRSNALQERIASFRPDLVFLIRGISFKHEALADAPLVFGWWIEREERVAEAMCEIGFFDWYFFMNTSCVEHAAARGIDTASYLPHSVDLDAFHPIRDQRKQYDLCFVGNWSPKRQEYLEAALEVSDNIAIYGSRWRKNNVFKPKMFLCIKGKYIDGEQLNDLYNASRVVLNITNWGKGDGTKRSGMNMRVLEVPATGSFLLTDGSRELSDFLVSGTHVGTYEGVDDFAAQFRHWLDHPVEAAAIAEQGRDHVAANFSYDRLVAAVIERYSAIAETPPEAARKRSINEQCPSC